MKRIFAFLSIIILAVVLIYPQQSTAKSPEKMSYQAVIRDNNDHLVVNHVVGLKISILHKSLVGNSVYTETQNPKTNDNGLLTLEIGMGTLVTGEFAEINWADGPYFIRTEVDPTGSSNYTISGTRQLLSVPYALHAQTAERLTVPVIETDPIYLESQSAKINSTDINNLSHLSGVNTGDQDLSEKVDKETGKGLSTNDYSDVDMAKVANLSGVNTGDQNITDMTHTNRVALNAVSGTNTGDQDLSSFASRAELNLKVDKETGKSLSSNDYTNVDAAKVANLSGVNSGDQDLSFLATQLALNLKVDKVTGKGLSTNDYSNSDVAKVGNLSGVNTGDQDIVAMTHANRVALDAVKGINTGDQDLSGLATKTELNLKVDKVLGKGLSTNDYTSAEQLKLGGIEVGAKVNVQSDWTQTDITADDYIKNKFDTLSLSRRINSISSIHDHDGDTKIQVEESPDQDIIHFKILGKERWTMIGARFEPHSTGRSVFVGEEAGYSDDLTYNRNVFLGYRAGNKNLTGDNNTSIGDQSLFTNSAGIGNVAIGSNAGYSTTGSGNVFLGYQAGYNETGSNKLYIENSNSATPLIYGDFENDKVRINGELAVSNSVVFEGSGTFPNLTVRGAGTVAGKHVALFENTSGGDGDGIKIKLGKASANNGLPVFDLGISAAEVDKIRDLINCNYSGNKITLLGEIVAEGLIIDTQTIGGLAVGVGNLVTGFINSQLHLPFSFPSIPIVPKVTVFPGYYLSIPNIDFGIGFRMGMPNIDIAKVEIGPYGISSFPLLPVIPNISLSALPGNIQEINITDLNFWGIPNICFTDMVSDPLDNNNEFIQFADKNDVHMGAVKAQSVSNWVSNYLNPMFLYSLKGALTSTLDKKHAQYHFRGKISEALSSYPKIGVEYSSGSGDYAEWLERSNPAEIISAGDIVAVKAGKITKDLSNAEQVMAVSSNPIVLGNVPPEGKVNLGNNIAFMGQIPVKIIGPCNTGDYIVGNNEIQGYGLAIKPENMTIENFNMIVGRAWETNPNSGAMTINTVIGVHNAAFLNVLKRYEQKISDTEAHLESMESKIDRLTGLITNIDKSNMVTLSK